MSDYLSEELVFEILLRLPVKSMIRCCSVCKSWKSLVESSAFINTHLSRQNDDTNLLLLKVNTTDDAGFHDHFLLHNPGFGEPYNLILLPILVQLNQSSIEFDMHGTCNGLIYLSSHSHSPYFVIIVNPSIQRFVLLPSPRVVDYVHVQEFHAFGFDMHANDYKLLRIISYLDRSDVPPSTPCEVEVYSLAGGCWKSLSADVVPKGYMEFRYGILLNGALHWFQHGKSRDNFIVTFDMNNERFSEMGVPNAMAKQQHNIPCMSRYGEVLAIVEFAELEGFEPKFRVWLMHEYGVRDSWIVLFSVMLRGLPLEPFGLTRNAEFMLEMFFRGLFNVNYNDGRALRFGVNGPDWCFVDSFFESLVLLRRADAISY